MATAEERAKWEEERLRLEREVREQALAVRKRDRIASLLGRVWENTADEQARDAVEASLRILRSCLTIALENIERLSSQETEDDEELAALAESKTTVEAKLQRVRDELWSIEDGCNWSPTK